MVEAVCCRLNLSVKTEMKTKLYEMAASEKMKSAILYPYGPFTGAGCCKTVHAKHLAVTSAIYTLVSA